MQAESVGILSFWAQTDVIGKTAASILLVMSIMTWYFIASKTWQSLRTRKRADVAMGAFWEGETLAEAVAHMQLAAPESPFADTAAEAANAAEHHTRHGGKKLGDSLSLSEFVTRGIRRAIVRAQSRVDSGLSILASIGATAPFVGLFGTVWGIYHALIGIGFTGEASIDKVAGTVGEALIMTAFGIAVAVPAVLGYNFLTRTNRMIMAELDAFAHDLHAYLTTGAKLRAHDKTAIVAALRQRGN